MEKLSCPAGYLLKQKIKRKNEDSASEAEAIRARFLVSPSGSGEAAGRAGLQPLLDVGFGKVSLAVSLGWFRTSRWSYVYFESELSLLLSSQ